MRRSHELAEWGETALSELRGPAVTGVRKRLAAWRDPRARLLRRRRRAKRTTVAGATATGTFGAGSVAAFVPGWMDALAPGVFETLLDVSGFGLAGVAAAAGAGTIVQARKYRRLKRLPLPEPAPEPVELPPQSSLARRPMQELRDAERSLYGVLTQLAAAGVDAGGDAVTEARTTADRTAATLRQVAERLRAAEAAIPHAPAADQEALRADVARLREELSQGVDGYGGLLGAASRALTAHGVREQAHLVQDATDRLAGLAAGLRELNGADGSRGSDGTAEAAG